MANTRKILFIIDSLARGGTELQLIGLINRLDRRLYSPYLCTIRPSDPMLNPLDCPHLAWNVEKLLSPNGLKAAWRLSRFLKRENFAVVQTFFPDSTVFGGIASRLAGTPIRLACFRDLGFWRTKKMDFLLQRVYPLMTGYLANALIVRDHFANNDNLANNSIQVIYNGIDLDNLPWIEHHGPTMHVGIVGNLNRRVKRTDLFLQAASLVAQKYPTITWHVVGDGQFRSEYEKQAHELGIGDRTVFTGNIEGVSTYLAKLQIGVLCSDSEGFSNALLEYMLRGCVSVATNVGGNPEAITDRETGLLVPPDNAMALANAIMELVQDNQFRKKLAATARESAFNRFGWDKCVEAHQNIYENHLS